MIKKIQNLISHKNHNISYFSLNCTILFSYLWYGFIDRAIFFPLFFPYFFPILSNENPRFSVVSVTFFQKLWLSRFSVNRVTLWLHFFRPPHTEHTTWTFRKFLYLAQIFLNDLFPRATSKPRYHESHFIGGEDKTWLSRSSNRQQRNPLERNSMLYFCIIRNHTFTLVHNVYQSKV